MIDLHLHLDGSLRADTVLELAKKQNISLPANTAESLRSYLQVPKNCKSLNEYLERFEIPLKVLQISEAIERVTFELVEDLSKMNVEYAEIRFAPQLSTLKGMSQEEVVKSAVKGLNSALNKYNSIDASLILCCMRNDNNKKENFETVEIAKKYLNKGVCALDLAGAESLFKTDNFEDIFERAAYYKIPFTIHAGEADGPESVKKALDFGAKRIGHGVHSIEDKELLNRLIQEKITLEMCIISNIHTKSVKDEFSHPIRKYFDMGVRVTVNTDNMTASNTNLLKEYDILKRNYNFTDKEIKIMNQYAKEAAFCYKK